jgi:hypothetical protein
MATGGERIHTNGDNTVLKIGDYARVTGLGKSPELNGRHVEVMTDLMLIEVPEEDGKRVEALRHGVRFITDVHKTGYIRPDNLEQVESGTGMFRAIWIHETGVEPPTDGDG